MNDNPPTALDRLLDQVPVGQAPISDLLAAGHAAKRRQRRTLLGGVAAATVLVIGGGTIATQALNDGNGHNNLVADRSPGSARDPAVRVESGVAPVVGVVTDDMSGAEVAFWDTDSQSVIYVSDYAYSSSCPPTANADVATDGALTLNVRDYDGQEVCTADAGRVTVFIDGLTQVPLALTIDDKAKTRTIPITSADTSTPDEAKGLDCPDSEQTAFDLDVPGPGKSTAEQAVAPFADGPATVVNETEGSATVNALGADGTVARVFEVTQHKDGWWPDSYVECAG